LHVTDTDAVHLGDRTESHGTHCDKARTAGDSLPAVLTREPADDTWLNRLRGAATRAVGDVVHAAHRVAVESAAIGPTTRRGKRFGALGRDSVICFPPAALFNESYIRIGSNTIVGPHVTLSVGMAPGQVMTEPTVVSIGDRCLIGRGSGIVGHLSIVIEDDVWTGHNVYITDQNHGYLDPDLPISRQMMPEKPVRIGAGSWLGFGTVVLPGAQIGSHVVIGANSVVTGTIPDYTVAAGCPARVVKEIRREPLTDCEEGP
jgi:acetyltransferase-like isoleucine patch superfamily enzyme